MKRKTFKNLEVGDVVRIRSEVEIKKLKSFNHEESTIKLDNGLKATTLSTRYFVEEWCGEEVIIVEECDGFTPSWRKVMSKNGETYNITRQVLEEEI